GGQGLGRVGRARIAAGTGRLGAFPPLADARGPAVGVFRAPDLARLGAGAPERRDGHRRRTQNHHARDPNKKPGESYAFGRSFENRSASFSKYRRVSSSTTGS